MSRKLEDQRWLEYERSPTSFVSKLRQVEVLQGQRSTFAEVVRQIGVTQQTFYLWRKFYGGMQRSQLARLKELEKESQRLRRAVSDLALDKLILTEDIIELADQYGRYGYRMVTGLLNTRAGV